MKWVEVTNDKGRNEFKMKVRVNRIRLGSTLVVYVDCTFNNPGPELRMVAVLGS